MKIQDITEGCKHGQYYCSTDKKWKCRQGPKQSRTTEAANPAQQAAIAIAKKKKAGVAEGSEEHSQNRLWQMITDYEQRAKATKNDIKKAHYLKMASELRGKLKTSDEQGVAEGLEEQVYKVVALDKSNALKKPTKLNVKASSIEDVFSRLAANDWYALSINGVEVVGGKRLKQGVAEGLDNTDDILQGLTSAYRTCVKHRDSYTNFGNIQTVYELLRDPLMKGDIAGYEKMHGYAAGKYPDAFDALMDEVSGEQGVAEEKTRLDPKCWDGYKKDGTKMKGGVRVNNCVKEELEETYDGDEFFEAYGELWYNEDEQLDEAEYQGRSVPLGKPMQGDVKKFKVYVKDPSTGNVKKVNFGDPDMKIRKSNPAARRSFRARHNCDNPGPRTKARYWSCRKW